ncbi:Frag1/DRAM/Sfk1 family-domain-containing protein [Umbelopsis sp. AD052]|nr:Frag1/DRAM/Sfk1 family-domain-containing protein [Umbelopsis sp. AD052]
MPSNQSKQHPYAVYSSGEEVKQPVPLTKIPAKFVSYSHTVFAYSAFFIALGVGCATHYEKIVRNEFYGYPDEWFPSVSATTGDRYPARAIFQIFIALTSGPRFALVFLWFWLTTRSTLTSSKGFGNFLLGVGLVRTVACGGWVYITSSDDHLTHDIAMVLYLLCTLPWQIGVLSTSDKKNPAAVRWRKFFTFAFFTTLPPMIYYFIQHKVKRVPGAYTTYAFFEWSLILYDVAFDAVTALDFQNFELFVVDVTHGSNFAPASTVEGTSTVTEPKDAVSSSLLRALADIRGYIADVYLAFVFWSMLTALALLIWYFPLFNMGISGYEAFLIVTISPMFLGIGSLRRLVARYRGVFHLLSLAGVASYLLPEPPLRLATAAFGISVSMLTWCATWVESKNNAAELERNIVVWGLGLLVHNLVKLFWWTENPIWPIMKPSNGGQNQIGLVLGIIACAEMLVRDSLKTDQIKKSKSTKSTVPKGSWLFAAAGFGSLLFSLHSMFSDSSTIMRWVVDGYPNPGPEPVPWGVATIAALGLGMVISPMRSFVVGYIWYAVGCAACLAFYNLPGWNGYYGGLVLGAYLTSVAPALIRSVVSHPPFKTLLTATMVYNLLCLAHVWVVAYEFVPGGVYARERTNWIFSCVMIFLGLGIMNAQKSTVSHQSVQLNAIRSTRRYTRVFLVAILALSGLASFSRTSLTKTPQPYQPADKAFTAGIWTIHFALDNDMWASETRMRDVIRDLELDVVGLLESDTQRIIMGNRDWAQYIAEDLGYYVDFGPATMKHTWGCLMLSKFPIKKSTHHLLPSPVGELACAIHATLDVYGQDVDFIVSHNGQEENLLDRRLQTTELARIMRESTNPFVFLGYVVTKPHEEIYQILYKDGHINDIDVTDHDRWCQYIGYRQLARIGYARVSHGGITDTEIQTGKFQIVDDPTSRQEAEYNRRHESSVPQQLRYPDHFRGAGIRQHHYHVLDNEPRYFEQ